MGEADGFFFFFSLVRCFDYEELELDVNSKCACCLVDGPQCSSQL